MIQLMVEVPAVEAEAAELLHHRHRLTFFQLVEPQPLLFRLVEVEVAMELPVLVLVSVEGVAELEELRVWSEIPWFAVEAACVLSSTVVREPKLWDLARHSS